MEKNIVIIIIGKTKKNLKKKTKKTDQIEGGGNVVQNKLTSSSGQHLKISLFHMANMLISYLSHT